MVIDTILDEFGLHVILPQQAEAEPKRFVLYRVRGGKLTIIGEVTEDGTDEVKLALQRVAERDQRLRAQNPAYVAGTRHAAEVLELRRDDDRHSVPFVVASHGENERAERDRRAVVVCARSKRAALKRARELDTRFDGMYRQFSGALVVRY